MRSEGGAERDEGVLPSPKPFHKSPDARRKNDLSKGGGLLDNTKLANSTQNKIK